MKIAFWISLPISLLLGWKFQYANISDVSALIISFIGILLAGMMPAMVMTVSLMQGDALSVKSLNSLRDTLKKSITDMSKNYSVGIVAVLLLLVLKTITQTKPTSYELSIAANVTAILFYWMFLTFLISFPLLFSRIKSALQIRYAIERENAIDKISRLGKLEKEIIKTPVPDPSYGKPLGTPK